MTITRGYFRTRRKYLLGLAVRAADRPLRAVACALVPRPAEPPGAWRRGLIVGHPHIGDVLYRTASLGPLAESFPRCEWHFLAAPGSAQVLRGNPHLAAVHADSVGDEAWQLAPGALARLRRLDFDVVLCTNSVRYYADLALALRLRAPSRVGFTYKGLGGLVTHPVPIDFPSPYPAYFRGMVAALAGRPPTWGLRPRVYPGPADTDRAAAVMREVGLDSGAPIVVTVLTQRQKGEIWPIGHWLDALRLVHRATDSVVALCGAAEDSEFLAAVARRADFPMRVLAGRLDLLAFAEMLRRSAVFFGVDSGPRHLANAAGIPVVFFRHLAYLRAEAGAYCDAETDLSPPDAELLTRPAQRDVLARIAPDVVAERVISAVADRRRQG